MVYPNLIICNLNIHVVFPDDLDSCLWGMLQQGDLSQIVGCFDIDWNKSSANNEVFLWR